MLALLRRDLRLATRAGGGFGLSLAFFLIVTVLVPFGVGPEGATLARIAPGVLWVGALLACLLSLDRIFALDREDGSLDLLATAPLPLEGLAAVKALAHWLTTGLPLALAAPGLAVLLNLPPEGYGPLTLSLLVGTPALSFIGAFGAAEASKYTGKSWKLPTVTNRLNTYAALVPSATSTSMFAPPPRRAFQPPS